MNWRGKPLTNYQVVIKLIGSTSTKTGLKIKAILDKKDYMTGIKISDDQMGEINIKYSKTKPKWNYRIMPLVN